jgi:hypothetical protein
MRRAALPALLALGFALSACKKPVAPGQPCSGEGEAVCQSTNRLLTCQSGAWSEVICGGPKGCATAEGAITCDESVGREGEPCSQGKAHYACSAEGPNRLVCSAGRWKLANTCRGPKGCEARSSLVACDDSIAQAGAPCLKEGDSACSVDGKAVLTCKAGTFGQATTCRGRCVAQGLNVRCQ